MIEVLFVIVFRFMCLFAVRDNSYLGVGFLQMLRKFCWHVYFSVQFSSVAQSCLTLCHPMNRSTPGLPVHHHLPEFTQTHVHRVRDAIQPSHPQSSPSPPAPNPAQHQSLFQWVNYMTIVGLQCVYMLCKFLLYSKVNQLYVNIYSLFFRFLSYLSHHKAMNTVLFAI